MNYYYIENLTGAELDALKKELVDVVDNLDNGEYVAVYNEYADANRYERIAVGRIGRTRRGLCNNRPLLHV